MIMTNLMITVRKADGDYELPVFTKADSYYYRDRVGYYLIQPDEMERVYIPPAHCK